MSGIKPPASSSFECVQTTSSRTVIARDLKNSLHHSKKPRLRSLTHYQHQRDETVCLHVTSQPFELRSVIPARLHAKTVRVGMPFAHVLEHPTGLLLYLVNGFE